MKIFNCYIPKKKRRLGPQNGTRSSGPKKLLKIVNYQNCQKVVLLVGKGGLPPISTWINPPSLGSNDLHCVEFPYQMRKFLLNLAPGEPLSLVQELPYFDDSIKMDPLMSGFIDICVHNHWIVFVCS
jgi:hypothetical protein